MTKWRGIRRDSIDIGKPDEGLLAINTRFKVDGELRRRRGLARTSIQKKAAGVTTISGFSAFQSNVMAALTDGDRIQGYQQPYSLWGDNPDSTPPPAIGGSFMWDGTESGGLLLDTGTYNGTSHAATGLSYTGGGYRDIGFTREDTSLGRIARWPQVATSTILPVTISATMEFEVAVPSESGAVTMQFCSQNISIMKTGGSFYIGGFAGPIAIATPSGVNKLSISWVGASMAVFYNDEYVGAVEWGYDPTALFVLGLVCHGTGTNGTIIYYKVDIT